MRIGHRRACPGGAMLGQLPKKNPLGSQLSVGLVPTEATTAKRLSHSLRWDKPKRGRRPRGSGVGVVVAFQSWLRWGKPNGGLATAHLESVSVRNISSRVLWLTLESSLTPCPCHGRRLPVTPTAAGTAGAEVTPAVHSRTGKVGSRSAPARLVGRHAVRKMDLSQHCSALGLLALLAA